MWKILVLSLALTPLALSSITRKKQLRNFLDKHKPSVKREDDVGEYSVRCANGQETSSAYVCDGDNDCGDCTDELTEGCSIPCVLGQWRADTGCQDANDLTGILYNGSISITETGKQCQAWSSQEPHSHTRGETGDEAILAYWKNLGQTPAEAGNSCRNPDGEPGPWCYTTEPDTRWELCKIPTCATNTDSTRTSQSKKSSQVELKKRSEFSCSNGEMTLTDFICDGDNDCGDCSDELAEGCTIPCVLGQWRADTGNTTGTIGEDQYFGYSDFQCANGEVTSSSYICDGDNDCGDCSDEPAENCTVPCVPGLWRHDDFQCHNNVSVSSLYVCDGDNDCDDCSDERQAGCDKPCIEGQWNAASTLSKKDYRRASLSKKKYSLVQRKDLEKRSDFSCNNGDLTMSSYVCDGDNDCGDCTDELQAGCTEPCVPGLWRHDDFQCSNGGSISPQFICDGDNDCDDCSDERQAGCDKPCVEGQWNADDTPATNGTAAENYMDYMDFAANTTAADDFLDFECSNGQFTSSDFVCDGDNDCGDCSDERANGCTEQCVEGQWNADSAKRKSLYKRNNVVKSEPTPFRSLGCWNDYQHSTGIPRVDRYGNNAINTCYQHALNNGFPGFALQAGGTCRTGPNILNQFHTMGQANNCSAGKGAGWVNDVYSIECDCSGKVTTYSSLGCWYDMNHDTQIPMINSWREQPDAIERCYQHALANGFPAFAVQDRGTCRTGPNILEQYNTMGPATNCANGRGGAWANDVYRIGCQCSPHKSFSSLGCWNDYGHQTGIPRVARYGNNAVNTCYQHAINNGFPGFALQAGGTCRTGPSILDQFHTMGQANNCSAGRGAGWVNDVYSIDCNCTGKETTYSSLGCWYDMNHDTQIPMINSWREQPDAIERCYQHALANGFPAFAVQDRGTCRTGPNILEQYNTMGPATNCANGRGGAWANDVYRIGCNCFST